MPQALKYKTHTNAPSGPANGSAGGTAADPGLVKGRFLWIENFIDPLLDRVLLLFYVSGNGCSDDIALAVHQIGGGISAQLRHKFLIEGALRIRRNILIACMTEFADKLEIMVSAVQEISRNRLVISVYRIRKDNFFMRKYIPPQFSSGWDRTPAPLSAFSSGRTNEPGSSC